MSEQGKESSHKTLAETHVGSFNPLIRAKNVKNTGNLNLANNVGGMTSNTPTMEKQKDGQKKSDNAEKDSSHSTSTQTGEGRYNYSPRIEATEEFINEANLNMGNNEGGMTSNTTTKEKQKDGQPVAVKCKQYPLSNVHTLQDLQSCGGIFNPQVQAKEINKGAELNVGNNFRGITSDTTATEEQKRGQTVDGQSGRFPGRAYTLQTVQQSSTNPE